MPIKPMSSNYQNSFSGIARLMGPSSLQNYSQKSVAIVGIGGVGSWAAEGLVRSGVQKITLIDLDDICQTNINRQLHATTKTIGKSKVHLMKQRLLSINPEAEVTTIEDFLTQDNVDRLLHQNLDAVIDAIDGLNAKCHLASQCRKKGLDLVVCGAAAGKSDPTQMASGDLGESLQDKLLKRMRKKLRREHGFPQGPLNIRAVFSCELSIPPIIENQKPLPNNNSAKSIDCESGLGSGVFLTATMGFTAVYETLNLLQKKTKIFL